MKKLAAAATGVVMLAGLTAGSVASSSSSTAPERDQVTKRLVLTELASKDLGRRHFVGADRDRSRATGDVVGFDAFSGVFHRETRTVRIFAAFALRGGIIDGFVTFRGNENRFSGKITHGSGRFRGVEGTIRGRTADNGKTFVTLRYRL